MYLSIFCHKEQMLTLPLVQPTNDVLSSSLLTLPHQKIPFLLQEDLTFLPRNNCLVEWLHKVSEQNTD